jgi:acylphosphatase
METPPARRAVRWLLAGRVQGVGFRYFAREAARELGVTGRVRNLSGGEVEVEAAGDARALDRLRERLREGPPGARVAHLSEQELSAVPAWDRFEIDR